MFICGADDLDAAGLRTLLALDHVELDLQALDQGDPAGVIGVDEDVLATVVRHDETETLGRVEKLHGACLHDLLPLLFPPLKVPRGVPPMPSWPRAAPHSLIPSPFA